MKYFKSTMRYFGDKGPYLVLINIVPALLLPFLLSPSSTLYYLTMFDKIDPESFAALYLQMRALPYDFFYLGVIGLILAVFSVSITFGVIDRHMRVGEFTISFRRAKTRINYNILTAIKFIALTAVFFELLNLFTTALYFLWATVFGAGVTWLVFSTMSFLLVSMVLLLFMSIIILWPPFMLHTGLKAADAFKMAWRQITGKVMSVALTLAAVVLPIQLIMLITGIFDCGIIVRTVLDGISYALIVPIYIMLMYNIFYDVTGTERMDLERMDIWSKKIKAEEKRNKRRGERKNGI